MVEESASILLLPRPGDTEYACAFPVLFVFPLFSMMFVTGDNIGRMEKVLPGSLSESLGLSPFEM